MVSVNTRHADSIWRLEEKGEAMFAQFGTNYKEFGNGLGNFTTAIIIWPDGTVGNIPVEHVRFLDEIAK